MMKRILYLATILLVAFACTPADEEQPVVDDTAFNQLIEDYYEGQLELFPLLATQQGVHDYDNIWPNDMSDEYIQKQESFYKSFQERLSAVDKATLSEARQLDYDILELELASNIDGLYSIFNNLPLNQMFSTPINFAQQASGAGSHPFAEVKDYENFMGRMDGFAEWTDSAIEKLNQGIEKGIVQPKIIIEKVIPQLQSLTNNDPEQSLFFNPLQNLPDSIDEAVAEDLKARYTAALEEKIFPSLQKLLEYTQTTYLEAGREAYGIDKLPGGAEEYKRFIKFWTTTEMEPQEIHDLGLSEVARIHEEMDKVKGQIGYEGTLEQFMANLDSNPELYPFQEPQEILDSYKNIENTMEPKLKEMFGLIPETGFEVRQIEAFRAAGASAHYQPGAPDGSRPGVFYVPIFDPTQYNTSQMESLFAHEAIPGHHYQISLQQELEDLSDFRRISFNSAYTEGWALYAESLGTELGLYEDPYQYIGRLRSELLRAVRLVVDTGLHFKGWSREEAIEYMATNMFGQEGLAINQIERYMVIPGQALSYKIGELTIIRLRKEAQEKLGDKFSLKEFHDEVLKNGSLPLSILEKQINKWIDSKSA